MVNEMPRPRWPYLQREKTRHGKFVWVVRKPGSKRTRIRAEFGTPDFEAQYHAAIAGTPLNPAKAGTGSLQWLWDQYRQSMAWGALSPSTRRQREAIMRNVLKKAGSEPFKSITRKSITDARDKMKDTPFQAGHFLKVMRGLFKWAIDAEHTTVDPCQCVQVAKPKSEGHKPWTVEEMKAFEKAYPRGTRERVAFDLLRYTGLRRGDVVRAGRQHVRNGVLFMKTEKTGSEVCIPLHPDLIETLEAGPTGDLAFIATGKGLPRKKDSFGNWFGEACRNIGVINKAAHGMRKTLASLAAEQGASEEELLAYFGWEDAETARIYTKAASKVRMAKNMAQKIQSRNIYARTFVSGAGEDNKSEGKSNA